MHADGSGQTNLTRSNADDMYPTWSLDGMQVVFDREIAGSEVDLFVKELTGSERPLVDDPGLQTTPEWSPDGSLVLFSSAQP